MSDAVFKNKKPNKRKLIEFGFEELEGRFVYCAEFNSGELKMTVTVYEEETDVKVRDEHGEEYVLHRIAEASGAYVGQVRQWYDSVIENILSHCFEPDVFKSLQAKKVLDYVFGKYADEPEYLWQKFPENAVVRRKDTKKWYAALLTVSKKKLGFEEDERIEILDLRAKPDELAALLDGKKYFPGYHMNKKHWYTVCLDGSVEFEKICEGIDESYRLAVK